MSPSVVDAHLATLHSAWWLRRLGSRRDLHRVVLLNPDRRANNIANIGARENHSPAEKDSERRNTSDRDTEYASGPENSGRSSRELGRSSRECGEICPNSRVPRDQPGLTKPGAGLTGFNTGLTRDRAGAHEGSASDKSIALACEILSEAIPPRGAAPIPANRHGARFLAQRLDDGTLDEMKARRLLARAPAIVARNLREPDRYGPSMFAGGVLDRWLNADAALTVLEENDAAEAAEREAFESRQRAHIEQLNATAPPLPFESEDKTKSEDKYDVAGDLARQFLAQRYGATEET
jgi:hypothetical protein